MVYNMDGDVFFLLISIYNLFSVKILPSPSWFHFICFFFFPLVICLYSRPSSCYWDANIFIFICHGLEIIDLSYMKNVRNVRRSWDEPLKSIKLEPLNSWCTSTYQWSVEGNSFLGNTSKGSITFMLKIVQKICSV